MKHLLYVAGPIRSPSPHQRYKNILNGEAVSIELAKMGFAYHCPHKNCEHLDGIITDDDIMFNDIEIMKRCDAAVFIDNWHNSVGAREEYEYCISHDLAAFDWTMPTTREKLVSFAKSEYNLQEHIIKQRAGVKLPLLTLEDIMITQEKLAEEARQKAKGLALGEFATNLNETLIQPNKQEEKFINQIAVQVISPRDRYLVDLFTALMKVATSGGDTSSVAQMLERLNKLHVQGHLTR